MSQRPVTAVGCHHCHRGAGQEFPKPEPLWGRAPGTGRWHFPVPAALLRATKTRILASRAPCQGAAGCLQGCWGHSGGISPPGPSGASFEDSLEPEATGL